MPIVNWLNLNVDQRMEWRAAGAFTWLAQTAAERNLIPDQFRTNGIACFEVPLIAAERSGRLNAGQVAGLSVNATANGRTRVPPAWCPQGLNRFYYGPWLRNIMFLGGWPRRGDVVYFWASGAGYFAHVAIATGNGSEVISFGHYETGRNDADMNRTLEVLTIEQIVDRHAQHRAHLRPFSAVYYGPGPW